MLNRLIRLAEQLDKIYNIKTANIVDNIIKNSKEDEWEDIPTKVDIQPLPQTRPLLDPEVLKVQHGHNGMNVVGQLRHILTARPNPDKWDAKTKEAVLQLFKKIHQIINNH